MDIDINIKLETYRGNFMKKTKYILVAALSILASVAISLTSARAFASWGGSSGINKPFPTNPAELEGAFSGVQYIGGKSLAVDVLIHGVPMSGSFIVTLLKETSNKNLAAQVFYAEMLEEKTLGMISLGLAKDSGSIDDKMPPAALMKISVNDKNIIQSIEVSPQDGIKFLEGPLSLTSISKNIGVSNTLAQGEYIDGNRSDNIKIYKSTGDDVLVSGTIQSLGISNDYSLSFDLTGVGAIRSRAYADHFQKREKPEISALLLPLLVGGKAGVIVVKASGSGFSDGNATPTVIMKAK